jgi:hypothetical protein
VPPSSKLNILIPANRGFSGPGSCQEHATWQRRQPRQFSGWILIDNTLLTGLFLRIKKNPQTENISLGIYLLSKMDGGLRQVFWLVALPTSRAFPGRFG